MAFYEVPDDFDFNSIGDAKAVFKPFKPEDVSGLKAKANEILTEKKAIEAQFSELQAQIKKQKVTDPDGSGVQSQLEDAMNRLKEREEALENLKKDVRKSKINGEAARIAASLTKDARRAALLAEKIAARLELDGDKIVVLDANGKHTISGTEDLASTIRKEYDFLVDGNQASGGGAIGGSGGAANTNTSGMTARQKIDASRKL